MNYCLETDNIFM